MQQEQCTCIMKDQSMNVTIRMPIRQVKQIDVEVEGGAAMNRTEFIRYAVKLLLEHRIGVSRL